MTCSRLPSIKQVHKKEPKHIPTRSTSRMHPLHKVWHKMGIQQHSNQRRWWMEGSIPNAPRPLQTPCNVFRSHELASHIPSNDEWNLQNGSGARMVISLHGWHCNTYETTQQRNGTTTWTMAQATDPLNTREIGRTWPIPQTGEVWIPEARNWISGGNSQKWNT